MRRRRGLHRLQRPLTPVTVTQAFQHSEPCPNVLRRAFWRQTPPPAAFLLSASGGKSGSSLSQSGSRIRRMRFLNRWKLLQLKHENTPALSRAPTSIRHQFMNSCDFKQLNSACPGGWVTPLGGWVTPLGLYLCEPPPDGGLGRGLHRQRAAGLDFDDVLQNPDPVLQDVG